MKSSLWPVWGLALSSAVAVLLACTEPPPPKAPQKKVGATTDFDPCEGSKPPWREYFGPLKGVRCEQEQFLRMADVARQLDVKCQHCHVPDPQKEDAFIYSDMTENKEKALWMHHSLMTGLHDELPAYCWASNKGYASPEHRDAIREHGISRHHRASWSITDAPTLF